MTIYTIGQESMGMSYIDVHQIKEWFSKQGYGKPDMVESCKGLGQKPHLGHLIMHPGCHCDNIMYLSSQNPFRAFLRRIAPQIGNHMVMCRHVVVVLVCRHGRHRSVAAATVLRSLVRETFQIEATVMHLGQLLGAWDHLQCDGTCDSCAWKALLPLGCVRPRALGPVPRASGPGRALAPGPFPDPRARPGPRPPGPGPRARAPALGGPGPGD